MIAFKKKIVLLGAPSVGKTSLLHRFVDNKFKEDYSSTIGVQFLSKEVTIDERKEIIQFQIWDVGGQSRFVDLRTTFYRGSHGALLVFDQTREKTLDEILMWQAELVKTLGKEVPIVLIGNKVDLIDEPERKINKKKAEQYLKSKSSEYFETSAKTGENVKQAYLSLARLIRAEEAPAQAPPIEVKKEKPTKKKGESLIVKNKIREYIKSKGCNTSSDLVDTGALNAAIIAVLDKAIARAKANGRKTVLQKDL